MAEKKETKTVFEQLAAMNVSDHIEKKPSGSKELSYLSWTWAVDQITRFDPEWKFRIIEFSPDGIEVGEGEHGLQYQRTLGGSYMVQTEVTIKGVTKRMWLPIMDAHNASMKDDPYKVTVTSKKGNYTYVVPAVDAMALNKTIMRCLVKNLALFGLGLYIFAGEDLPNTEEEISLEGNINPETGEVGEVKQKATPKPKKDVKPMSEEEALVHCFENGGELLKGKAVLALITESKDPEKSRNLLTSFANNGIGKDKEACQLILKALEEGRLNFPKEAAE